MASSQGESLRSHSCSWQRSQAHSSTIVCIQRFKLCTATFVQTGGTLAVDWIDPETGMSTTGEPVTGTAETTFLPPFAADAVLHLRRQS